MSLSQRCNLRHTLFFTFLVAFTLLLYSLSTSQQIRAISHNSETENDTKNIEVEEEKSKKEIEKEEKEKEEEESEEGDTNVQKEKKMAKEEEERKEKKIFKKRRLPQALLIGQMKCGTGAVKNFFQLNPHMESVGPEVHYFDRNDSYAAGPKYYLRQLPESSPDQITLEGTPRYFFKPWVPERVHAMNASIKLLAILCDPTRRLVSEYVHHKHREQSVIKALKKGVRTADEQQRLDIIRERGYYPPFEELVFTKSGALNTTYTGVSNGMYIVHLRRWLKYFPRQQIHLIDASEFLQKPWEALNKAAEFLSIPASLSQNNFYFNEKKGFYCKKTGCLGSGKGRKHPVIPDKQIARIREFYQPYNEELMMIFEQKFDWG